jgi:uncharacterized membrane protein
MPEIDLKVASQCALIGVVAGLRSMLAPAAVVSDLARHRPDLPMSRFFANASGHEAKFITLANALGEAVFDKLPFVPARTAPGSVIARSLSGALSGGALGLSREIPAALGAALGLIGAIGGTYGAYHARKWIGENTKVPDPVIGLAEDGIAVALARIATL